MDDQTLRETPEHILRRYMPEPHREWLIVTPASLGWVPGERLELDDMIEKVMHFSRQAYNNCLEFVFIVGPQHLRRHADLNNADHGDIIFPLNRAVLVSSLTLYRRPDGRYVDWKRRYPHGHYPVWTRSVVPDQKV